MQLQSWQLNCCYDTPSLPLLLLSTLNLTLVQVLAHHSTQMITPLSHF